MNIKINIRWSNQVKFITVIVGVLLIFTEVASINGYINSGNSGSLNMIIIAIIIAITVLFCILSVPRSITLTDSQLILKRVLGKIIINYSQIGFIALYIPGSGDIRVCGSGGFCGYIGVFSNKEIGKYTSYVGDPKQAFLIRTKSGENYVFSCENAAFVIETIKKQLL